MDSAPDSPSITFIHMVPDGPLWEIFFYLSIRELMFIRIVCRKWFALIKRIADSRVYDKPMDAFLEGNIIYFSNYWAFQSPFQHRADIMLYIYLKQYHSQIKKMRDDFDKLLGIDWDKRAPGLMISVSRSFVQNDVDMTHRLLWYDANAYLHYTHIGPIVDIYKKHKHNPIDFYQALIDEGMMFGGKETMTILTHHNSCINIKRFDPYIGKQIRFIRIFYSFHKFIGIFGEPMLNFIELNNQRAARLELVQRERL